MAVLSCWFHVAQAVMRQEKQLHLLYHYCHNYDQILYTRALWTLSLVPEGDIIEVFNLLKEKAKIIIEEKTPEVLAPMIKLYEYFERNYIANDARFVASKWCWFQARDHCVPRATSEAEVFHRQLNKQLSKRQSQIGFLNDVMTAIMREIGLTETRGSQ